MQTQAAQVFRQAQQRLCETLERLDGAARFGEDGWQREGGGGGNTRVMQDGAVFEKAAVNWSEVWGELVPEMARALPGALPGDGTAFYATGVSLIVHPRSPMVPTAHLNVRMLSRGATSWFGGGADLTPYYVFDEDAARFHRALKDACDRHDPAFYPGFKTSCDDYFFLRHRNEPRGIGGVFFDYLRGDRLDLQRSLIEAFSRAYGEIVEARRAEPWGERERAWQLVRRGRYVEFNLLYDRGTSFGLRTDGRVESILVSLPPLVRFGYDVQPEPGSREEASLRKILERRDWASGGSR